MYCNKCGFKYEGNFCPMCGAKAKKINMPVKQNNSGAIKTPVSPQSQGLTQAVADVYESTPSVSHKQNFRRPVPSAPLNCVSSVPLKPAAKPYTNTSANPYNYANQDINTVLQSPYVQNSENHTIQQTPYIQPENKINDLIPPYKKTETTNFAPSYTQPENKNSDCASPYKISGEKSTDFNIPYKNINQNNFSSYNSDENYNSDTNVQTPQPAVTPTVKHKGLTFWKILLIVIAAVVTYSNLSHLLPASINSFISYIHSQSEEKTTESNYDKIKIGETFNAGDETLDYCVTEVKEIKDYEGSTPDESHRFISVTLRITNKESEINYPEVEVSMYADNQKCRRLNSLKYSSDAGCLLGNAATDVTYIFAVPENAEKTSLYVSDYYDIAKEIIME